ncbi:hypothetical protein MYSEV_270 [Mythimna separata entomopoxvirus 'L']|uniref:Uncharacterized protein n=1 Tax=Mythimna separata entomopoxvirus 'L' TaxID=1293572 RepID=A0A916NYM9_9POXV|nr:hypothetical protein MYSEV_270 [Mythimna separata entomopoxvirus 'L']CCU56468.1 hypothetical protein MYSEV_270 [Mythimna separata entomopoxvirus 'L']
MINKITIKNTNKIIVHNNINKKFNPTIIFNYSDIIKININNPYFKNVSIHVPLINKLYTTSSDYFMIDTLLIPLRKLNNNLVITNRKKIKLIFKFYINGNLKNTIGINCIIKNYKKKL